jgi:thiol-disulfide isomerase/thioredoxin
MRRPEISFAVAGALLAASMLSAGSAPGPSSRASTLSSVLVRSMPSPSVQAATGPDEPSEALDQLGRSHVWKGASGHLTLLEFSASWCAPCRWTLPRLEALARAHPSLRVLAVSVDERREGRDELVNALDLSLPMLWDDGHRIAEHYAPRAMPATLLLSPEGKVLHTALGSSRDDWDELVRRVEDELQARPGGQPPQPPPP